LILQLPYLLQEILELPVFRVSTSKGIKVSMFWRRLSLISFHMTSAIDVTLRKGYVGEGVR
jgi:hypothetical protein